MTISRRKGRKRGRGKGKSFRRRHRTRTQARHRTHRRRYFGGGEELTLDYYGYVIEPQVKTYLDNILFKKSASVLREKAKNNNLMIPLYNYPDDTDLKLYLVNEVLELASNDAFDYNRGETRNVINMRNITKVISMDPDLNTIFH